MSPMAATQIGGQTEITQLVSNSFEEFKNRREIDPRTTDESVAN